MIGVILALVLDHQAKDFSAMLTIAVCAAVGAMAAEALSPVLDLLQELETMGGIQGDMLEILLKAVGIGLTGELIGMICTDAGKGALGKSLQLLGSAAILSLSVPVIRTLLTMIRQILGVI